MFGVIIGATAALATVALLNRRRACRRGYRWHRHGHPYPSHGHRGWRGRGASGWVARLADRIDATPAQERVMHDAVRELIDELRPLRGKLWDSRSQLADAFGDERFDAERMGELFATHDELLDGARKAVVGALGKIHDVLEPGQRSQLARFIGRRGNFAPYRM